VRHFLVMTAFAILAAVVFGTVAKNTQRERVVYGVKVFIEFIAIGLLLGWLLYFLPF
jgi:MFS-type transporter involved in bile tolerance (Atg22 family)